jgi:hypothetical protein
VRKLILAFADNESDEVVDERGLSATDQLHRVGRRRGGIKPETAVFGEYNALPNIFSIAGTNTTGGDIRARSTALNRNGLTPLWMTDLEKALIQVAEGGVPKQTEFICFGNDERVHSFVLIRRGCVGRQLYKSQDV